MEILNLKFQNLNIKKIVLGLVFLYSIFYILYSAPSAHAQDQLSVRIVPALVEDSIEPGDSYSYDLTVTNLSGSTNTYYFTFRDISNLTQGGQPIFADNDDEQNPYSLKSWVNLPEPVTLEPDESGTRTITVNVPADASPGGHFGAVFASLQPDIPDEEVASGVGANVGSILNFRIRGDILEEAQIREFSTNKTVYTDSDVIFQTRLENLGNVLLRPRGPVEITNIFGKEVATLIMNDTARGVFPGQIRDFELVWDDEGFKFGRYQALLGLVYGQNSRKSLEATVSFWVLPLNVIGPVIGGIFLLILTVFLIIRWSVSRKIKAMQGIKGKTVNKKIDKRLSGIHSTPISKLALTALSLLLLALIFLIVLFFLFG